MNSVLDFCENLPSRQLTAGETLIELGGVDNRIFILRAGAMEITKQGVQINTQDEPGAIFGELSVLLGMPHTASVTALAQSEVYVVENASDFLRAHPDITFFVTKLLARRLKSVSDYLVDIKRQFEDETSHLSIMDEVLESLAHQQDEKFEPGSDRCTDVAL
jgi:CRP/FNR family cyclic AMP-dependent transcriptional regulator